MDFRLVAGAVLGSALTLAVASIADVPRSHTSCSLELSEIHGDLVRIEGDIDPLRQVARDASLTRQTADEEAKWAQAVNSELGRIRSNIEHLDLEIALRR